MKELLDIIAASNAVFIAIGSLLIFLKNAELVSRIFERLRLKEQPETREALTSDLLPVNTATILKDVYINNTFECATGIAIRDMNYRKAIENLLTRDFRSGRVSPKDLKTAQGSLNYNSQTKKFEKGNLLFLNVLRVLTFIPLGLAVILLLGSTGFMIFQAATVNQVEPVIMYYFISSLCLLILFAEACRRVGISVRVLQGISEGESVCSNSGED